MIRQTSLGQFILISQRGRWSFLQILYPLNESVNGDIIPIQKTPIIRGQHLSVFCFYVALNVNVALSACGSLISILDYFSFIFLKETNRLECLIPKKTSLRHRLPMGDQGFIDFVAHLLEVNPKKRPSALEALKHPWLSYPYEPISS